MTEYMDEEKFIAALVRKFRAVEVDPPPPPATPSTPSTTSARREPVKCVLCRRSMPSLVVDDDGRAWCPKVEWDKCTRIAAGRLGASGATGSESALKGILESDGKCRDCGEPVRWVKTQRGKKMPVNVHPAPPEVAAFELVGENDTLAFYISEKRRAKHYGDVYEFHGSTCRGGRRRG